ncbi:MAG: hypothetical protein WCF33_09985 [Pseudonocardiaceae bacterium]
MFPAAEFTRAEASWRARRTRDDELLVVRAKAADLIHDWTGRQPRDVGAFRLRLNLETSDLDLGIGYPVDQRDTLITVLCPHTVFKGERKTRFSTTRLVFAFTIKGLEVNLSALTNEDFTVSAQNSPGCPSPKPPELTVVSPQWSDRSRWGPQVPQESAALINSQEPLAVRRRYSPANSAASSVSKAGVLPRLMGFRPGRCSCGQESAGV